jgi:uncharacterized protein YbjT (DUF2867 family)
MDRAASLHETASEEDPMFAVAGVTGNTGKVVAETLLARGHAVRVIVRDPVRGEPWRARGAEVAVASLADRGALARALAGVAGAYVLLPPRWDAADPVANNRTVAEAITGAASDAHLPHAVLLSSIGAQHPDGTGPIKTLYTAERMLREVTALTAIRAASFLENWGLVLGVARSDGILPTFIAPDAPQPTVSTPDIGRVSAEMLISGPAGLRVVELAGPTDPSARDAAAALSTALGRPVTPVASPPEAAAAALAGIGVPPQWAALYQEMYVGVREGRVAWEHGRPTHRGTESLLDGMRRIAG